MQTFTQSIVNALHRRFGFFVASAITILSLLSGVSQAQVTVTGGTTAAGPFATLSAAITAINGGGAFTAPVTVDVVAGHTETLTAKIILTATGTLANPLVIQKSGAGANPVLTSYVGTATTPSPVADGFFVLAGSDYVTIDGIDLQERATNTTTTTVMEYGYGLFKASVTNGCQNNIIRNCTITLNRLQETPWTTGTGNIGSVGIAMSNSTHTVAAGLTPTAASGSNSFNKFYSNTIQNCNAGIAIAGFAASAGVGPNPDANTFFGDLGNDIGGSSLATGNNILNYGGATGTTNASAGIFALGQWNLNCSYNTINNNNGSGVNHPTTLRGIYLNGSSTSASGDCNNNIITLRGGGTTTQLAGIESTFGATAAANTINLNNNTVNIGYSTSTSATVYGIYNNFTASPFPATVNILGNTVQGIPGTPLAGTSTMYMIDAGAAVTVNVNNNIVHNIERNSGSTGTLYGIRVQSPTNYNANNNLVENLSFVTATATSPSITAFYSLSSAVNVTMTNNIARNLSTPATGTLTGIREFGVAGTKIIQNNQVYNFTTTAGGAGGFSAQGIYVSVGATDISNNVVYAINSTGTTGGTGGTIDGIWVSGGTASSVYKNKIYDISSNSTGAIIHGIRNSTTTASSNHNIYNNLIGDLRTPNANVEQAVIGINISTSTATVASFVDHNTIYLEGTSAQALFGATGVLANTGSLLTLRNNIIVNNTTPVGLLGYASAFRRSSATLGTYQAASGNNLYYAGTPGPKNLIYYDGTNASQGILDFQPLVTPRDGGSFSEPVSNVAGVYFQSFTGANANFLHLVNGLLTPVESGGQPIASITDDFDGQARSATTPDVGADEFSGLPASPSISNVTVPTATCTATAHVINADVVTPAGTLTSVTLNYNNGTSGSIAMTLVSGNTYTATIPAGTPAFATTWNIIATNSLSLNAFFNGTGYTDDPLATSTATATANPATICAASESSLSVLLAIPNNTISLGAGSTTGTTWGSPFYTTTGGNRHGQYIIRASELQAIGLAPGNINSIGFDITAIDATDPLLEGYSIQMGHTSLADLSGSFETGPLTTVVPAQTYQPVVGINTFTFTTPFVWDGVSNVIVDFCFGNTSNVSAAPTNSISSTARGDIMPYTSMRYAYHSSTSTPVAPVDPTTACGNTTFNVASSSTLSRPRMIFNGGLLIPPTSVSWSDGSSTVGTGTPLVVSPISTTTYTATITALGCTKSSNSVTITTLPLTAGPTVAPSTQCGVGVPLCFAVGGNPGDYRWYLTPTGGTPIAGETNGSLQSYSITATTTFYVAITGSPCETARTPVTATVVAPDPIQALVDNNNPCRNDAINLSVSQTGSTNNYVYTWTASPAAGSGIASSLTGGSQTITPTAAGTYLYTVAGIDDQGTPATSDDCNVVSTISVVVKELPDIYSVTATPSTVCAGAASTLNGLIFGAPLTQTIGTSTTTLTGSTGNPYRGSSTENNQIKTHYLYRASELTALGMQAGSSINSLGFTVSSTVASGVVMNNFELRIGHTSTSTITTSFITDPLVTVYTNAAYVPLPNAINVHTFSTPFIWDGVSNIVIERRMVHGPTLTSPTVNANTQSTTLLSVVEANSTTAFTATTGTTTTTRALLTLNFNTDNSAAYNWVWNPGALAGSSITVNPTSSPSETFTATATDPVTTCSASESVTVTVNPIPADPTGNNSDQCGAAIPAASVSSNSGATTPIFNWYDASTGGTLLQTGTSNTYLSIVTGPTTFYVSEISAFGCESGRTPVSVTFNAVPDVLTVVSSTGTTACLGETFSLSSAYTPDYNTYQTFTLTAAPQAASGVVNPTTLTPNPTGSDPYSVTPTALGTYVYSIEATDPDKGCINTATISITVVGNPAISSVTATPATICDGQSSTLSGLILGGSGVQQLTGTPLASSSTTGSPYRSGAGSNWQIKQQSIVLASELTAFGLVAGSSIISLGFTGNGTPSGTFINWEILIGHTSQTDYATGTTPFITTPMTSVFTLPSYTPVAGVNTHVFSTPFTWDGVSNIVIETRQQNQSLGTAGVVDYDPVDQSFPTVYAGSTTGFADANGIGYVKRPVMDIGYLTSATLNYTWVWNPGAISGSSISVSPTNTTAYTATATDPLTGCFTESAPVTVTVNPIPAAPTASLVTRCGPGQVTLSALGSGGSLVWYNVPTGGTAIFTGAIINTSVTASTNFYVAEVSALGCEGPRTTVSVTVTPPPALVITPAGSTTFCAGGSVILDGVSGSGPLYVNFSWSPTTGLSAGNTGIVTANPTETTTYTLTANDGDPVTGCNNTASITITVNPNPVIESVTASPQVSCAGSPVVLTGTTPSPDLLSEPFESFPVSSFATSTSGPGTATWAGSNTYYSQGAGSVIVTYSGTSSRTDSYLAMTNSVSLVGAVNPRLVFSHICASEPGFDYGIIEYSTDGGTSWASLPRAAYLGSGTLPTDSDPNITPFVAFDKTTYADWNAQFTSSTSTYPAAPATSLWKADSVDLSAYTSSSDFRIRFRFTFDASVSYAGWRIDDVRIKRTLPPNIYSWSWDNGAGTGSTVTVNPTSTTTYIGTVSNNATGCSTSQSVTVTVNPTPAAPAAITPVVICGAGVVNLSATNTGGTLNWYNVASGGTPLATGDTYSPIVSGSTSFWVSETYATGNCEGPRTEVVVTVTIAPPVTIVPAGPVTICEGSSITLDGASGTPTTYVNFSWTPSDSLSATNTALVTANPTSTTTYTLVANDGQPNGCQNVATITINVNPAPVIDTLIAVQDTICAGQSSVLSATILGNITDTTSIGLQTGQITGTSSGNPYRSSTAGFQNKAQFLIRASELTAAGILPGNITKLGFRTTAVGVVLQNLEIRIANTALTALTSTFETTGFTTVFTQAGTFTPALGANLHTFQTPYAWNGTSNLIVEFRQVNTTTGTSSIASNSPGFTGTVQATSTASAFTSTTGTTSGSRPIITLEGIRVGNDAASYNWVWTPGGQTTPSITVTPAVTTLYTATATIPATGCTASDTVRVTVNPVPAAPVTNGPIVKCGAGPVAMTATNTGGTMNWYTVQTGGTPVFTGNNYTPTVIASTSYWVAETYVEGCEGPRTEVVITITPAPPVVANAIQGTICEGGSTVLNTAGSDLSYVNFTWTPAGSLSSSTGASVTASPIVTTTYSVTADDGIVGGCTNVTTVTVTVNPAPVLASLTATPVNICNGSSSTLEGVVIGQVPVADTIGNQTTTGTTTGGNPYRTSTANNQTRTQLLVRASELASEGYLAGPISKIGFITTAIGTTPGAFDQFEILMNHTTTTALTTTFATNITTPLVSVFAPAPATVYTPVLGLNVHNLSTPFNWNGTDNILVEIRQRVTVATATTAVSQASTLSTAGVSFNGAVYAHSTTGFTVATGTTSTNRTRIMFEGIQNGNNAGFYTWNWTPGSLTGAVNTVSPTSTTTYNVTVTNPTTTCTKDSFVTVSVLPLAANANQVSPTVQSCGGTEITLASGATGGIPLTYSWSDGTSVVGTTDTIKVSPINTTTYTVTVTDACNVSVTSSVTVTVTPTPNLVVNPSPATICAASGETSVLLTASGADTYEWFPAAGLSTTTGAIVTASPTVTSGYTLTGTNTTSGCAFSISVPVYVVSTPINGLAATATPNPVCEGSTLSLNGAVAVLPKYSLQNNSAVAFIDISTTGTDVPGTIGDDTEHNITLPPFIFNGVTYTNARVGNNGLVVLGASSGEVSNTNSTTLPSTANSAGNVFLAPFWDDLDADSLSAVIPANRSSIKTDTVGNTYIIQWTNLNHFSTSPNDVTFQLQLDIPSGTISFVYEDVTFGDANDAGASATVAIQWASTAGSFVTYSINTASLSNGQSITFAPQSYVYSWTGPNGFTATTEDASIPNVTAAAAGVYNFQVSINGACATTVSTAPVVVNARPTAALSGDATILAPASTNLSIAVTGTGPWSGTLLPGNIPFSGTSSPIIVSVAPSVSTTYTINSLSDATGCNPIAGDITGSAAITVVSLNAPAVTVVQPTCADPSNSITVTSPLGAFTYSIDGTNYQVSNVFNNVPAGSYNVTFKDVNNFVSPATPVTINPQPITPAAPVVTGLTNVCPFLGNSTQVTYTATAAGATGFTWTVPANVTIVSGQGTANLTVTFAAGFATQANKQIRVTANSVCGTSPISIYYLLVQFPSTPAPIVASSTDVCAVLGTTNTITYTIPKVTAATSYIWSAQSGTTTITSVNGAGPNDTTVTVTFAAGFTTSAITVRAVNDCGTSGLRSLTITRANPSTPSPISGPTQICEFRLPGTNAATYSVPLQPGVTTYTWNLPMGSQIISGQGTNTISFIYPAGYTGGNISVIASNGCGTSGARSLTVGVLNPGTPTPIDVIEVSLCPNRVYRYSLASLPANAVSVNWTIPAGGTIVSGLGTSSIDVSYPPTAINGTVTAQGVNSCGVSTIRSLTVKLAVCEAPAPPFTKGSVVAPAETASLDVVVFPNPSVSDFKLQVKTSSKELIHVRVLDMAGRQYSLLQMMPHETLNLGAQLKAGSYLLEVRQGKQLKTAKVLKF